GRLEPALADVRRAEEAGGARTEAVELREKVLHALDAQRKAVRAERRALDAARDRLERGDLDGASAFLRPLRGKAVEGAQTLDGRLESARKEVAEVRERLLAHLRREEWEPVLGCLERLSLLAGECPEVKDDLENGLRKVDKALEAAWARGELGRMARVVERAGEVSDPAGRLERWATALATARELSASIESGEWGRALITAGRLSRAATHAKWIREAEVAIRTIEGAHRELLAGPLGDLGTRDLDGGLVHARTAPVAAPPRAPHGPAVAAEPQAARSRVRRFLFFVDGAGTFLVLTGEAIGIGRAGSSARPDVALAADLQGVHAQIVRADSEYFLVARGPVSVGGSPIEKHLLRDGDSCALGPRARFRFSLPSSLSTTAILELDGGARLDGDVRRVILLDRHLILGADAGAHIKIPRLADRVILSATPEG